MISSQTGGTCLKVNKLLSTGVETILKIKILLSTCVETTLKIKIPLSTGIETALKIKIPLSTDIETVLKIKILLSTDVETALKIKILLSTDVETTLKMKIIVSIIFFHTFDDEKPVLDSINITKTIKMKIEQTRLGNLRNDEHFQLMQFVTSLVAETGADKLNVGPQAAALAALHAQEREAMHRITKSAITAEIRAADRARDEVFRGFVRAVNSARLHFMPSMRKIAKNVGIAIAACGRVTGKSDFEETAAMRRLCENLETQYADDIAALGLSDWVASMKQLNTAFEQLLIKRLHENAARTPLILREVRPRVDKAYTALTAMIAAQSLIATTTSDNDTIDMYNNFISHLNKQISMLNNTLAIRRGIAAAEKARKKAKEEEAKKNTEENRESGIEN